MKRKHIPAHVQIASLLLQMEYWRAQALKLAEPAIPYEHSKKMTAHQIRSLFHIDHNIMHRDGGPDEPWNLHWRYIGEHREKTKADVKAIAKSKRIQAWDGKRSSKRPGKQKRKILSRPFPKRLKRP